MQQLDNLVKINQLKLEAPDQKEFDGLLESGRRQLRDAQVEGLSSEGKFSLAYGAAHAFSVAAIRWYGYRSSNRHTVFKCLQYTVGFEAAQWRVLDECHRQRNLAEYQGELEITEQLLAELLATSIELLERVEALGSAPDSPA